jgi:cyclohexa-1,5-dienecarbonyl-CoA hydratase
MAPSPLKVWRERDGRLLRLRLSRPKANLIDAELIAALDAALSDAARPAAGVPAARAVLLDAEGPHFSFGASVQEHLPGNVAAMLKGLHALVLKMLEFPAPILVVLRGQCIGGGLEVAATGHLLFAAPDAKLGQPEIVLGVFAPAASCLLPERIGRAAAEDLLLSGRSIDAAEAHRLGLVNDVVDPDRLEEATAALARRIAPTPLTVLRFTKLAITRAYEAMGLRVAQSANLDLSAILNASTSPEQEEFDRILARDGLKAALAWRTAAYEQLEDPGA